MLGRSKKLILQYVWTLILLLLLKHNTHNSWLPLLGAGSGIYLLVNANTDGGFKPSKKTLKFIERERKFYGIITPHWLKKPDK